VHHFATTPLEFIWQFLVRIVFGTPRQSSKAHITIFLLRIYLFEVILSPSRKCLQMIQMLHESMTRRGESNCFRRAPAGARIFKLGL